MSSFAERHHEAAKATLFDAWYELQNARCRERLDIWIFVLEALFSRSRTSEESASNMARSLLWATYESNTVRFMAQLDRPLPAPLFEKG